MLKRIQTNNIQSATKIKYPSFIYAFLPTSFSQDPFVVFQGEFELSKNLKATLDGWLIVVLYNFKKYTPKRIRTSDPQLRRQNLDFINPYQQLSYYITIYVFNKPN